MTYERYFGILRVRIQAVKIAMMQNMHQSIDFKAMVSVTCTSFTFYSLWSLSPLNKDQCFMITTFLLKTTEA
jgi:hypothetical protein